MGLNRYKLGSLITPIDERNTFGYRDFYGINIHKEFMPTVANTEGHEETKYKVFYNILSIVKDEVSAEDILQETYLRFLNNLDKLKKEIKKSH